MKKAAISAGIRRKLETAAVDAARRAYAPYSHFRVGAAVLTPAGAIYTGCNVENASYGMCTCAERTAVLKAVSSGERTISAVAVYTPTRVPTSPCGACRQVISEFGPEAIVISVCDTRKRRASSIDELLPEKF